MPRALEAGSRNAGWKNALSSAALALIVRPDARWRWRRTTGRLMARARTLAAAPTSVRAIDLDGGKVHQRASTGRRIGAMAKPIQLRRPSRVRMTTASAIASTASAPDVAIAAPASPYKGMRTKLSATLNAKTTA